MVASFCALDALTFPLVLRSCRPGFNYNFIICCLFASFSFCRCFCFCCLLHIIFNGHRDVLSAAGPLRAAYPLARPSSSSSWLAALYSTVSLQLASWHTFAESAAARMSRDTLGMAGFAGKFSNKIHISN